MRKIKHLHDDKGKEYRLDVRGSGGVITAVRILTREPGGGWQQTTDAFTEEHSLHLCKFAKVAGRVAKTAMPPFDLDAIVREAASSSSRKTPQKKKAGNGSSAKEEAGWA
jgi:hypothetical protein